MKLFENLVTEACADVADVPPRVVFTYCQHKGAEEGPAMATPGPRPAPALANNRASSTASVMSSGNGQVSPAASNRWIVNRTVEGAVATGRAISQVASRPTSI